MHKTLIASIAGLALASTPAIAQSTIGGGASASGPQGSVAGGVTAGTNKSTKAQKERRNTRSENRRGQAQRPSANSSSTYGSGTVYTDRNRATGGVTAGGTATGTGRQSSSTAIDAYGSTGRDGGSEAEVYGDSTARSGN